MINKLSFIIFLIAVSACRPRVPQDAEFKLIGGTAVAPGEYPSTFLMRSGCTGTKIGANFIITAAHCVMSRDFMDIKPQFLPDDGQPLIINRNHQIMRDSEDGNIALTIVNTYAFPNYWRACQKNCGNKQSVAFQKPNPSDLAIIEVKIPTPGWDEIPSAKLADLPASSSEDVTIIGYGCEKGINLPDSEPILKKSETLRVLSSQELTGIPEIPKEILPSFTKNFYQTPGRNWPKKKSGMAYASACPGDSGGPLYVKEQGVDKLIGINSFVVTASADDDGVSILNAHARADSTSIPDVAKWLKDISDNAPLIEGKNVESEIRTKILPEETHCRYCRMVITLVPQSGSGEYIHEWQLVWGLHDALVTAGIQNFVYRNSVEISRKHKRAWVNIKLLPGGNATAGIEHENQWKVSRQVLQKALSDGGFELQHLSSYIELLDYFKNLPPSQ